MLLKFKELKQIFPAHNHHLKDEQTIEEITTDSRKETKNSLFIPIIGEKFNGHHFADQAIANGAIALVWDEKEELPTSIPEDFPIFYTKDTTKALQNLAAYYRREVDPIVIGITGSNGKTTTKDLVASLMRTTYQTHATEGNLNNHIGLPLTILSMPRHTEVLVLELGMSDFGEIDLLTKISEPDVAIITNIGESHIEYLGSKEGIAKAKLEIINGMKNNGILIVDGDEPLLEQIHTVKNLQIIRCGFSDGNDLQILETKVSVNGTTFKTTTGNEYFVPLAGKHHAKNSAYALQLAKIYNIPIEKQLEGLRQLSHSGMRFELQQGLNGAVIVNDSYNASPTSMKASIEVIKEVDGFNKKILVLGDILELGEFADDMHRSIAETIVSPITHLYTYGVKAELMTREVKEKEKEIRCEHFQSKEKLVNTLKNELTQSTIVLFKASRGLQFETMVVELLLGKSNEEQ